MSDYLWDKTGEADAEVERLELLLGSLRHAARPLELPAESAPPEPRGPWRFRLPTPFRASRFFAPAGLAAAAALLFALLLGASVYLRPRQPAEAERVASPGAPPPLEVARSGEAPLTPPGLSSEAEPRETQSTVRVVETGGVGGASVGGAVVAAVESGRGSRRRKGARSAFAEAPGRVHARQALGESTVEDVPALEVEDGMALGAMRASGDVGAALLESTRLLAKEQLVYALRLTGARLRDVRQMTQGSDDSRPPQGEFERVR
jgi:hypothetical protein